MVTLPEHDHCKNCGDPIPFDMAYCCEKCYYEHQAKLKKEKDNYVLFWTSACTIIITTLIVVFSI